MTDYSKPIGWWCPECGDLQRSPGHDGLLPSCFGLIAWMHSSGCTRRQADTIPVFAVIPEGERPQTTWDEPEVALEVNERGFMSVRQYRVIRGLSGRSIQGYAFNKGDGPRHMLSIGDAVLWVVEGKRP